MQCRLYECLTTLAKQIFKLEGYRFVEFMCLLYCNIYYIPRRKSGIYWIQVRRAAAAAAAAVEISLWTR